MDSVDDKSKDRFIEVLRGISLFLVVYYHYTDRLPYEVLNAPGPASLPFYSGKIGVYIFFAISGFLIAKSLEGSRNLAEFYAKRITRLWPLFALASFIIFAFLQVFEPPVLLTGPKQFYEDPVGIVDLAGQLFFLNDLGFQWVDGVFWSLLVELKFYLFIALFALAFRRRYAAVFGLVSLALASFDIVLSQIGGSTASGLSTLMHGVFVAQYLPLFAIGVMMHARLYGGVFMGNMVLACVQAVYAVSGNPSFEIDGLMKFGAAFAILLAIDAALLKNGLMLFLGKYSYAIYLFHQMIGLTVISMLAPRLGYDLAMAGAIAIVISIAVLSSMAVEWRYRRLLTALLIRIFTLLRLDRGRLSPDAGVSGPQAPVAEGGPRPGPPAPMAPRRA